MWVQQSFRRKNQVTASLSEAKGDLYLIPTPLGNLEDMTYRAVDTLKKVDLIAAEDTRTTQKLLNHFGIKTGQTSFHAHNWPDKIPQLIAHLKKGRSLAQVSDAGMPSISDPGYELVQRAIEEEIAVIALPGPSAGITGLIASGLMPQPHVFYGFLPRKKGEQREFLSQKQSCPESQIIYESPHRVVATLSNILEIYGDRQAVLARELTKIYEEYRRGTVSEILDSLTLSPVKGECILILAGSQEDPTSYDEVPLAQAVADLIQQGYKPNVAIKQTAKGRRISRQEVYKAYHHLGEGRLTAKGDNE